MHQTNYQFVNASILSLLFCLAVQGKELWIYCPANLLVQEEVERVEQLMTRASMAGYTHMLVTDSKFSRLDEMGKRYYQNVQRVRTLAEKLRIKIVPALHSVGYSNDLLSLDPNLAEALPVVNASFVVQNGLANIDRTALTDQLPSLEARSAWGFIDESLQWKNNTLVSSAPHSANVRMMKTLNVQPFQHYHVSIEIKTEGFDAPFEVKPMDANGNVLSYTNLKVQASQDWSTHHVTFNSLNNTSINLYLGAWGPTAGNIALRNPVFELAGAVNMVRRSTAPIAVQVVDAAGTKSNLTEDVDFERWFDPQLGSVPYAGEYDVWHQAPAIKLKKQVPDKTRLLVSYFHTHIVYDGQVCGSIYDQGFQDLLVNQSKKLAAIFPNSDFMMEHDEYRVMGWTKSDLGLNEDQVGRNELPSFYLSHNAKTCFESLRALSPTSRVLVWSDMFDIHHNAKEKYYLVNGSLAKTVLPHQVAVMNWNSGHRAESLKYFAERGHHQVIAGFYDSRPQEIVDWLEVIEKEKIPDVDGVMYTTWRRDYSQLEKFSDLARQHAWYKNN